jgi:hypothetical protein
MSILAPAEVEHVSERCLVDSHAIARLAASHEALRAELEAYQHKPLAQEVNRRRGEMAGLRETMRENGVEAGSILACVHELLIYKRAMESMAAQFVHPKTTAMEMATQVLRKPQ